MTNSTSPSRPARERTITLTVEQWADVVSALHWTQREILTEGKQRQEFYRIEQSIGQQLAEAENHAQQPAVALPHRDEPEVA